MPSDPAHLKSGRRDPGSLLASQIEVLAGDGASVTLKRERPWASITFAGTRHRLAVNWDSETDPAAVKNLAEALPYHEFSIAGHFVADILVTEQTQNQMLVEALSIIDPIENCDD